jgi:hypothetical protein
MKGLVRTTTLGVLGALVCALHGTPTFGAAFRVNAGEDAGDAARGDGVCATESGTCTLRAAIQESNSLAGPDVIEVPPGTYTLSLTLPNEEVSGPGRNARDVGGDLDLTDDVVIKGGGAKTTTVDANRIPGVFNIVGSTHAAISGLTIRNSSATAILLACYPHCGKANAPAPATLDLRDSVVSDNDASGAAMAGGLALYATANLNNVTVSDNAATGGPGAISTMYSSKVTLTNVTITGNSATGAGRCGAIWSRADTPDNLTLVNVTVSRNSEPAICGQAAVMNTIIDGGCETIGSEMTPPRSRGHNLERGTSCKLDGPGDLSGRDPRLADPGDNGGETPTQALLADSPAIDAGGSCPSLDQRGVTRAQGAACDIGAFEGVKAH